MLQAKDALQLRLYFGSPGAANLLSGVADAYFDSLPVIFITGQLNTYEYSVLQAFVSRLGNWYGFHGEAGNHYAITGPWSKTSSGNWTGMADCQHRTKRPGSYWPAIDKEVRVEDPVYDMKFSEEEIEAAVYGKNDPENGAAFYRDAVAKKRILLTQGKPQNISWRRWRGETSGIHDWPRSRWRNGKNAHRSRTGPSHSCDHKRTCPVPLWAFGIRWISDASAVPMDIVMQIWLPTQKATFCFVLEFLSVPVRSERKFMNLPKERRLSGWILTLITFREKSMREEKGRNIIFCVGAKG